MKNYRLHTSEGVRDYFGDEVLIKRQLENNILNLLLSHGYQLVKTPTFEYIDVFSVGKRNQQQPDLYNLINRQGEFLALRSDMTAAIARVVSTKDNNDLVPKKYCYLENTFRYPAFYQGKSHEFTQAGIELIGIKDLSADIEIIKMAANILLINNITDFTIHISNITFLDKLLKNLSLPVNIIKELKENIAKKDFVSVEKILITEKVDQNMIELIDELMKSAGRLNFLKKIKNRLDDDLCSIIGELEFLYNELEKSSLQDIVIFDFSIYVYADYYTGLVFQIFADGAKKALINGGRYDDLLQQFACSYPAVGFGADVDSLLDLVQQKSLINIKTTKILSFIEKDSSLACHYNNKLRSEGKIVEESLHQTFEEAYQYAQEKKIIQIIKYHGDDFEIINLEETK